MKIKRLEQELGAKVFVRTPSRLQRTAAGDAYLQFLATKRQADDDATWAENTRLK